MSYLMIPSISKTNNELEAVVGVTIRDPLNTGEAPPTIKLEVHAPAMVVRTWINHLANEGMGPQSIADIRDYTFRRHVLPLLTKVTREYGLRRELYVAVVW